ncbi:type II toxin-antitoxin system ParD family antitoxin [uncultured Paraglaciecola sp.]|uniref:ribbon-helix-helix domain-containing protein n=1 Tax=uncultured Paraglaciecola sp. TaxID=1765024 RepID=UPI00261AACBB|nr:type II toxin-antitoxin system ParD family antitoxin [uncultured Paraglaciecola sp.]
MAMVKKSITVTDTQDVWMQSQLETGNYSTDSELIRDALREKQMRIDEINYIREKLISAENSGYSLQTPDEIRNMVKTRLKKDV